MSDVRSRPDGTWEEAAVDHNLSTSTIRRLAADNGYRSYIARRKPFIGAAQATKRLLWAKANVNQDWRRVIFTDEVAIELGGWRRKRVIRQRGHAHDVQYLQPTFRSSRMSLHVWGAIAYGCKFPLLKFQLRPTRKENGKKLAAEKITGEVYGEQVLWDRLSGYTAQLTLEGRDVRVVEDNAPIHNSKTTNGLREQMGINRLDHPPSSPDLNPIENCWWLLKAKISKLSKRPTNLVSLWEAVQTAWGESTIEESNKYIDCMEERRRAVLSAKGFQTSF